MLSSFFSKKDIVFEKSDVVFRNAIMIRYVQKGGAGVHTYHLAIDIGASSGRHILGHVEDGTIILEEIYRFPNSTATQNGHLCWDVDRLFSEILTGMAACRNAGKIPVTLGIEIGRAHV